MKVIVKEHICIVTKEPNDSKIYNESALLYQVKNELIRQGYDVIKKLMWKDGHLVSDTQHYIRTRKEKDPKFMMIWDTSYAVRFSYEEYNKGELVLAIER